MIALVTSIGEPTTELATWALLRNGFEVKIIQDSETTLWQKLKWIYENIDEDFIRVDADTIVNRNCTPQYMDACLKDTIVYWCQFLSYDWLQQDTTHGGVQFIRKGALQYLRKYINEAQFVERPESYMFRIEPFHNPRRCVTQEVIMGINGYGITDIERVKGVKRRRGQLDNYDFELAEKLDQLLLEKNSDA